MWRACDIALRATAPSLIKTSRPESLQNIFFSLFFIERNGPVRFLAKEMHQEGLTGYWSADAKNFNAECSVPYEAFDDYVIDINYYYPGWTFYNLGVPLFLLQHLVRYPFFRVWIDRTIQVFFNLRPLARLDRMKVLSYIFRQTIKDSKYQAHTTNLLTHFYSSRWALRKDFAELMTYYGLLLDSLKQTGDLAAGEHGGFKMNPQALNTIAAFQLEERRHRNNYSIQRGIFYLTLVLMVVGIAQATTGGFQAWLAYVSAKSTISDRPEDQ
ncbi:hypothetical protein C8J37_11632 [Rhizobium sp. PP-WC-1G-195]|nr:hypothetical protein C8J37_11632 [Rhizobium sp. PP-WC-1G-195]